LSINAHHPEQSGWSSQARRDAFLAGHAPASTLVLVSALADLRFMVKIEAEAAN
jgi:hypothetical protein